MSSLAPFLAAEPEPLTPRQRFRLVEIAHESRDAEVRRAAMALLEPSACFVSRAWSTRTVLTNELGATRDVESIVQAPDEMEAGRKARESAAGMFAGWKADRVVVLPLGWPL